MCSQKMYKLAEYLVSLTHLKSELLHKHDSGVPFIIIN